MKKFFGKKAWLFIMAVLAAAVCGGTVYPLAAEQVLLAKSAPGAQNDKDIIYDYNSLAELAEKKIGILTGSVYDAMLKETLPKAEAAYYNNYPDMIEALTGGKIDGFVVDEPIARNICSEREDIAYLQEYFSADSYAFAVAKDNEELGEEISQVLEEMREDKTLEEIDAKWFGTDGDAKVMPVSQSSGEKGTLKVIADNAGPPFTYVIDGKVGGYDIEVLQCICDRLGYKMEVTGVEFASVIPGVVSGKYDIGAGCITMTEERAQSVSFTAPDYEGGVVMMVRTQAKGDVSAGFWQGVKDSFEKTFIRENRWKLVLNGLGITCLISILSAIFGSALGFGICMMRRARFRLLNIPARIFVRIVQGTPIVVILMILYYIVFTDRFSIAPILVAVIGFSINFGAYVSEMMRAGIEAVDPGQIEAAGAMGYRKAQVFVKITFPQAARHFLPVLKGEFISMVKMTSVAGYIAIQDLTKVSDIIRSRTYEAFFPLIATAVIYFLLSGMLSYVLTVLEKRTDPKQRKREVKGVRHS